MDRKELWYGPGKDYDISQEEIMVWKKLWDSPRRNNGMVHLRDSPDRNYGMVQEENAVIRKKGYKSPQRNGTPVLEEMKGFQGIRIV